MSNLINLGDKFNSSEWIKISGVTVDADRFLDPLGSTTADEFKKTIANSGTIKRQYIDLLLPNTTYTVSLWCWRSIHGSTIRFLYNVTGTEVYSGYISNSATTEYWQRRWFTFTTPSVVNSNQEIGFQITASASDVNIHRYWGFQLDVLADPGVSGENIPPYELDVQTPINIVVDFIDDSFQSFYPIINNSESLFIYDYNIVTHGDNLFHFDWTTKPADLTRNSNASAPSFTNISNATRFEVRAGMVNYIYQTFELNKLITNRIYNASYYVSSFGTLSNLRVRTKLFFGRRLASENPGKSEYELDLLGTIFGNYLTIDFNNWQLNSTVFTAIAPQDVSEIEIGIEVISNIDTTIDIADFLLVEGETRLPFIYHYEPIIITPEFIDISLYDEFNSYFIPTLSGGIEGGYNAIIGNAIPYGNSIGQRLYDRENNFPLIYTTHSSDILKPAAGEDPFGLFSGALYIKKNDSSAGINLKLNVPLLTGFPYTLSVYVQNQGSIANSIQLSVSGTSDNAENELDNLPISFEGGLFESVSLVDIDPPVYIISGPVFEWKCEPENIGFDINNDSGDYEFGLSDRVFVYWNKQLIPSTYYTWQFWYCASSKGVSTATIYSGIKYTNSSNQVVDTKYNSSGIPVIVDTEWRLFEFGFTTPSTIPLDFKIGLYIAGSIRVQGIKLYSISPIISPYSTVYSNSDYSRITMTFNATSTMQKLTIPQYNTGFTNPFSLVSAPININIKNASSLANVSPLLVTGLQLVEGIIPQDYIPVIYSPFFIGLDSIPDDWNIEIPTVKNSNGPIQLKPPFVDDEFQFKNKLGINLAHANYYGPDPIFLNLIKQGKGGRDKLNPYVNYDVETGGYGINLKRSWFVSNDETFDVPNIEGLILDENGWPIEIPENHYVYNLLARTTALSWRPSDDHYPYYNSGRYVLSWFGNGEVDLVNRYLSPGPFPYTIISTTSNSITFDVDTSGNNSEIASKKETGFYIRIKSTDSTNHVRNMSLVEERYLDLYNSGEIFYPEYIDKLKYFSCIRFMHWQYINGIGTISWNDRPKIEDASWADSCNGAPIEVMIELCNKLKRDMWFCVPTAANDEYVRNAAILLRNTLDSSLRLYLEYSNEWWNGSFWSGRYLSGIAKRDNLGDVNSSNPDWDGQQHAYARRMAEIFNIFSDEFSGISNIRQPTSYLSNDIFSNIRLIRVIGSLRANKTVTINVWNYAKRYTKDVDYKPADAIAPNAYFGNSIGSSIIYSNFDDMVIKIDELLESSFIVENSGENVHHRVIRNSEVEEYPLGFDRLNRPYSVSHTYYEGGFHLAQSTKMENYPYFVQFAYSNEAYNLTKKQLNWWYNLIANENDDNQLYCWFENANVTSIYGTFGISPKSVAISDFEYFNQPRVKALTEFVTTIFYSSITLTDFIVPNKRHYGILVNVNGVMRPISEVIIKYQNRIVSPLSFHIKNLNNEWIYLSKIIDED